MEVQMFIKKLVATALFTIAATAVATVTANGQAGVADLSLHGVDGAVAYTTNLAADHSRATVDLASGKFSLAPDAITVTADNGSVVGTIPTTMRMQTGEAFTVMPSLDSTGTVLTLTPVTAPTTHPVATPDQLNGLLHNALFIGAAVGAGIGCAIGIAIGIWFFIVGAVVGCAVGAAIGATIGFFAPVP